jgi:NTE family protein
VCIDLELDRRVGLWDTAAMPYLFEAGWRAAERALPCIAASLETCRETHH